MLKSQEAEVSSDQPEQAKSDSFQFGFWDWGYLDPKSISYKGLNVFFWLFFVWVRAIIVHAFRVQACVYIHVYTHTI